ncbi:MAG: hypothetical protein CMM07_17830 [Rhodopirellula sp.]|nr:hypothetical protein [Rhodopirellula sp.]
MEHIQDPTYNGNVTVHCTYEEWIAREEEQRKQAKEQFKDNPKACARKLYEIATQHTSGGRAASALLLSLWNEKFVANIRDVICNLDIQNTEAAIALLATLGPGHHLERYLTQEQIIEIIDVWGDMHERRRA